MKKLSAVLMVLVLIFSFAGCKAKVSETEKPNDESVVINLATLKGPTGMGMVKLIADDKAAETQKYNVTLSSAPEDIKSGILNGSYDIAAIPTNLAALLYNKAGADISVLAVNTLGVLYVLENGDTVKSIADLAGKKIYATGQASTPEYILNYVLEKNGVDVEIEYLTEHSELAVQMASGAVKIGVLPEPNVTTAIVSSNGGLRVALDLTEEWEKAAPNTTIMQGCIVVKNSFLKEHPDEVKAFMAEYKKSVDFVNGNIDEAAALCEETGIVPKAAVAKKAIPNCNITFVTGQELKSGLNAFLKVLYDANPASVGDKLPDDAFYYIEK